MAFRKKRKFSYRIVFVPETIGSIAYINKNLKLLKKNVHAGFIINCLGDEKIIPTCLQEKVIQLAIKSLFIFLTIFIKIIGNMNGKMSK